MSLPPLTDHAFMRLVRKRCEDMSRSMSEIAAELGCDVDELCRWIMAYKAPRKGKPYLNRYSEPLPMSPARDDPRRNGARFAAWRKAQTGAAEALKASKISASDFAQENNRGLGDAAVDRNPSSADYNTYEATSP